MSKLNALTPPGLSPPVSLTAYTNFRSGAIARKEGFYCAICMANQCCFAGSCIKFIHINTLASFIGIGAGKKVKGLGISEKGKK